MAMTYFRNLFFQTDDGITLYVRDYPGPSPDAPVVLCLHGLSRNSRDFEDLAPHLQTTHRVLVPDQRGRGRSEHDPVSERYLPQNYVGDVVVLDYDPLITAPMKSGGAGTDAGDLWPLFDTLRETPVLLIRGGISDLLDPDCVAEMRRRHSGLSYLEVPDVGHAPMLDEPGVVDTILDFLAQ